MRLTRRKALTGGIVTLSGVGASTMVLGGAFSVACGCAPDISKAMQAIEARTGQRIGVSVLGAKLPLGYRENERFAMCSTFKWILAAAVLKQAELGQLKLTDTLTFTKADLVPYAPVVEANLSKGELSIEALCEAIITTSDNAAANLLLGRIGGPEAVTDFCRSHGDRVTRLDRVEPELNSNVEGDIRDTSTPNAMAGLLMRMVRADMLRTAQRQRLGRWMTASQTGRKMIRAALPQSWNAGDKTGSGENGAVNDVAFVRAPGKDPLTIAIFTTGGAQMSRDERGAIVALITRQVLSVLT